MDPQTIKHPLGRPKASLVSLDEPVEKRRQRMTAAPGRHQDVRETIVCQQGGQLYPFGKELNLRIRVNLDVDIARCSELQQLCGRFDFRRPVRDSAPSKRSVQTALGRQMPGGRRVAFTVAPSPMTDADRPMHSCHCDPIACRTSSA
ncbi:hypothetical protein [Microbacterium sp. GXF6406]